MIFLTAAARVTMLDDAASLGVHAEWLTKDKIRLLAPFHLEFQESLHRKLVFTIPEGFISDGASIPRWALFIPIWSIIGHPFQSEFIRAALIHDKECRDQLRPSDDVHMLFYQLLLHHGVTPWRAKMMWRAVQYFGPHWEVP